MPFFCDCHGSVLSRLLKIFSSVWIWREHEHSRVRYGDLHVPSQGLFGMASEMNIIQGDEVIRGPTFDASMAAFSSIAGNEPASASEQHRGRWARCRSEDLKHHARSRHVQVRDSLGFFALIRPAFSHRRLLGMDEDILQNGARTVERMARTIRDVREQIERPSQAIDNTGPAGTSAPVDAPGPLAMDKGRNKRASFTASKFHAERAGKGLR